MVGPQTDNDAKLTQEGERKTKKRTTNPGVRHQGGRIYDSENGTTCHQCRQKTIEVKAKCTSCTLYFCPRCLENRYKEKVDEVNATHNWSCPRCRKVCNCSNCRKKQGLEATGILAGVAKSAGFGSVSELLEKNPNARSLSRIGAGNQGKPDEKPAKAESAPKRVKKTKSPPIELVDDATLGTFSSDVEFLPVKVQGARNTSRKLKTNDGKATEQSVDINQSECPAMFLEILEFVEVFRSRLKLRAVHAHKLAMELLTRDGKEGKQVADLHCRLLEIVRDAWEVKSGTNLTKQWTQIMLPYLERLNNSPAESAARDAPAAVAGELASMPSHLATVAESAVIRSDYPSKRLRLPQSQDEGGSAVQYPHGGYWALPLPQRIKMLHALIHDALDTWHFREYIENQMESVADDTKEQRSELAKARKEARQAALAVRDREIALTLASCDAKSMTLEEQAALVAEAKERAEAELQNQSVPRGAMSRLAPPSAVRAPCLGYDRTGRTYWRVATAGLYAEQKSDGPGLVLVQEIKDEDGDLAEAFSLCCNLPLLLGNLDGHGKRESILKTNIAAAFKMAGSRGTDKLPKKVDDLFSVTCE